MKYSVKIASAWGIPIELHITFILLIIAVFAFTFPNLYDFYLILFLFIFVTVHEISHSAVARRYNIRVRKIVLYPIGGVSEIEEIPDNPRIEWRMAIAGPLASLIIGVILIGLNHVFMIGTPSSPFLLTSGSFLEDLGFLNILLGAFNLIPAFPMDGGRVFRALLAERMSFTDATKYASFIGRFFAIVLSIIGFFYNFFLIIIGIFIYIGATEEAEQTIISTTLARVRVRDVMGQQPVLVKPDTTVAQALDVMLNSKYHDVIVQTDENLSGIVPGQEMTSIKTEQRATTFIQTLPMKRVTAYPDESVLEAYKRMMREKIDLLPIVDKNNPSKVIGVLTSEGVSAAYEKAKNLR
jgi:Zn-dependent protease/CBS domain-containing protein